MRWRRTARGIAVAAAAAATAVTPAVAGHAGSPAPGLRVFSAHQHMTVVRFSEDTSLFLQPSIYVGSTNGAFEIDVTLAPDGSVTLWQVRRDSAGTPHRLRRIDPPRPVKVANGLPKFLHVTITDSGGAVVAARSTAFCPSAGYGSARVDSSGPDRPTYPVFCGSRLTQRTVWGIDRGWAESVNLGFSRINIADGDYTLTVAVAPSYAQQLHLPAGDASTTIDLTVVTQDGGPCPPEIVCTAGPAGSAAALTSAVTQAFGSAPKGGSGGYPDLAALPAYRLMTEHNEFDHRDYLDFAATIWNAGPGPLELDGFLDPNSGAMTARQFIYKGGSAVQSSTVGQFEFDTRPGHSHWHMADVAQYDLLSDTGDRLILSDKQSFCLAPTDPIDLLATGALWEPDQVGLTSACPTSDSIWLRESLPAGWGDTYLQTKAGQSFDITGLPNGYYRLRITTNPFHRLLETSYDDNTSVVRLRLSGRPHHRHAALVGVVSG